MPQFDFSVYLSQIFWFGLCFASLYAAAHFVILPRLKEIIHNRNSLIDSDSTASRQINLQIESLEEEVKEIKSRSAGIYQSTIDEAIRQSAKRREDAISTLKSKLDELTKNSRKDIENFVAKSIEQSDESMKDLVSALQNKILN